jgi:Uma2 family endonuclease
VLEVEERDAVVVPVFPLGAQEQNRLFLSHFLLLYCEEDGAGGAWRRVRCRRVRGERSRRPSPCPWREREKKGRRCLTSAIPFAQPFFTLLLHIF